MEKSTAADDDPTNRRTKARARSGRVAYVLTVLAMITWWPLPAAIYFQQRVRREIAVDPALAGTSRFLDRSIATYVATLVAIVVGIWALVFAVAMIGFWISYLMGENIA